MSYATETFLPFMTGGLGLVAGLLAVSFARPTRAPASGVIEPSRASSSSTEDSEVYEYAKADNALLGQYKWDEYETLSMSMKDVIEMALFRDVLSTGGFKLTEADGLQVLQANHDLRRLFLDGWKTGSFKLFRKIVQNNIPSKPSEIDTTSNGTDKSGSAEDEGAAEGVLESGTGSSITIYGGTFNQVSGNQILYSSNQLSTVAHWLSETDYQTLHRQVASKRVPNTGAWMLKSHEFMKWLGDPSVRLLWCTGIPGGGKTTIASLIIDDLRERRGVSSTVTFAYFSYLRQPHQNQTAVLRALLRQIYEANEGATSASVLEDFYKARKDDSSDPSARELRDILAMLLRSHQRAYIVLDALDEYQEVYDGGGVRDLLDMLLSLGDHIKVVVTSRILGDMVGVFLGLGALRKEIIATTKDIANYLGHRTKELQSRFNISDGQRKRVIARIMEISQGRFLLAELHMNFLLQQVSFGDLEEALDELPVGMDSTYRQMMERIDNYPKPRQELAKKALMWTAFSKRQLSIGELQHALAMRPGRDDVAGYISPWETITSLCAGLLVVQDGKVMFIHATACEFFQKTRSTYFPHADEEILKTCIAYLMMPMCTSAVSIACRRGASTLSVVQHTTLSCGLYGYSATHLGQHARHTEHPQKGLFPFLLRDTVAVSLCCTYVVQTTLQDRWHGALSTHGRGGSSVFLAIYYHLDQILPGLLDDLKATPRTERGRTPLLLAALFANYETVKSLLDWPRGWLDRHRRVGDTPLPSRSSIIGDINERDRYGRTPLSYAASSGEVKVVKLLLRQRGIDVNAFDVDGKTPLAYAAWYGHAPVVAVLLQHPKISVNLTNNRKNLKHLGWLLRCDGVKEDWLQDMPCRRTPLSYAAEKGHKEVVRHLIEFGNKTEVNWADETGRTPLAYAVENNFPSVVRILMESPQLEVNVVDSVGRTPLIQAAAAGSDAIVRLLLDRTDIDTCFKDPDEQTALSHAVQGGYEDITRLLLQEQGMNLNLTDKVGRSPLSYAAACRNTKCVALLLSEEGILVNAEDHSGRTPLSYASQSGQLSVVKQFLLHPDIQVNSFDNAGHTPLSYAVQEGHFSVAQILLDLSKQQLNWAHGTNFRTLLSCASENGNAEMVSLLLGQDDIDANLADRLSQTPIAYAAQFGHKSIVELLLARPEVDPNLSDERERTPLSLAIQMPSYPWWVKLEDAELWMLDIVKLFCRREDVNLNKPDDQNHTPLWYATRRGCIRVATFLKERGAT